MDKFNRAIEPVWVFLHRGYIIRRALLFYTAYLMGKSWEWATAYANMHQDPTAQQVAMIGVVTGVASTMFGAALKLYNSGRAVQPLDQDGK